MRNNAPAAGQTDAIKSLTDVYSRLVGSADLADRVNTALGTEVPPGSLSACPDPGLAGDPARRHRLQRAGRIDWANAGAKELSAYVAASRQGSDRRGKLFTDLNTATQDLAEQEGGS